MYFPYTNDKAVLSLLGKERKFFFLNVWSTTIRSIFLESKSVMKTLLLSATWRMCISKGPYITHQRFEIDKPRHIRCKIISFQTHKILYCQTFKHTLMTLANPKSAIFTLLLSPTRIFLAARSL